MQFKSPLFQALFVAGTAALSIQEKRAVRRQDGPVDPGTAPDCTFYDTAYDESMDCQYFEDSWFISHANFVDYNPSVKDDCSGIKVGNSYCVEVNYGLPRPTTTSSTSTVQPTPTGNPKPSPTQDGLIGTCTSFYLAVKDDTCDSVVSAYGGAFTFEKFLGWNPAVGDDCSGLWLGYYYCVGVPGTPTVPPTTTTTKEPTGPTPTQEGIVANCQRYHLAVTGDNCQKIVNKYGAFSLANFKTWNPAVGSDCSGVWLGYYYCIGIPGTPTTPTAKPTATCNPTAPTPTQPTAVCGCKKWHKVVKGDICASIIKKYGITSAKFHKWNPNVGTNCATLWSGYHVCVGV